VDVDLDLQSAIERIHGPRWSGWGSTSAEAADDAISTPRVEDGGPAVDRVVAGTSVPRGKAPRSGRTRGPRARRSRPPRADGPTASDAGPTESEALSQEEGD
jgi:hypothetical protein